MASITLDGFDVAVAGLEFERCAEMPQAVKDNRQEPDFLNKAFQLIRDLARLIRASGFMGDNKTVIGIALSTKFLCLVLRGFHIC